MKKAKMKSTAERHVSYQKPALRSEAFARALSQAKLRVVGSGGLVFVDCQLPGVKGKMKGSTKSQKMDEPFSM